ncbi:hypothetical protein BCR33DRAFT_714508, partial [Rhizoclosmatium globosum]
MQSSLALPPELLNAIIAYLPQESVKCLRLVNRLWLSAATTALFRSWHPSTITAVESMVEERPSQHLPSWKPASAAMPTSGTTAPHSHKLHPIECIASMNLASLQGFKSKINDTFLSRFVNQRLYYSQQHLSQSSHTSLVRINLTNCFSISDSSFLALIDSNTLLREIIICGCTGLTDTSLIRISQVCTELVQLDISLCRFTTNAMNHLLVQYSERKLSNIVCIGMPVV